MPRHLAALSAMALSLVAPQWAGATTYTRDEAVKIALEKSSDVKTAEEEVQSTLMPPSPEFSVWTMSTQVTLRWPWN